MAPFHPVPEFDASRKILRNKNAEKSLNLLNLSQIWARSRFQRNSDIGELGFDGKLGYYYRPEKTFVEQKIVRK